MLKRWLEMNKPEQIWVADVVDEANRLLDSRDLYIGPSYFMDKLLDDQWVSLIWKHSIIPYVREQLFGQGERISEFDLETLKDNIG